MSKILVAEDNLPNRELIREVLQYSGYEVIEAENGQEALDKLEQILPDLVLLDIGMPVLDGYAVVTRLREMPRFAGLKVLALTAYAMRGDRERVLKYGFDGYLTKPIDIHVLRKEISGFLGQDSAGAGT
jgi:CheY-like chemotaxis protein